MKPRALIERAFKPRETTRQYRVQTRLFTFTFGGMTRVITSSIARAVAGLAVASTVAVAAQTFGGSRLEAAPLPRPAVFQPADDPVATLIKAHGCWTQDGPVGVIPGHVIYDGRYLGARATGHALDAVFGKPSPLDPSLVSAFCR